MDQNTPPSPNQAVDECEACSAANLDLGHFAAGNHTSPVPFLKQGASADAR